MLRSPGRVAKSFSPARQTLRGKRAICSLWFPHDSEHDLIDVETALCPKPAPKLVDIVFLARTARCEIYRCQVRARTRLRFTLKPDIRFHMQGFKRNQVEEAIAQQFGRTLPDGELRTRIKRLLDTDRTLPLPDRSALKRAFYSDEGPGRGNEVIFSEYEAFALLLGLRLLNHHWPQQTVVEVLRGARKQLAVVHGEILDEDPKVIFDKHEIRRRIKKLGYDSGNTRPALLVIYSDSGVREARDAGDLKTQVFRDARDALSFTQNELSRSATFMELVTPAHRLHEALLETSPAKRGRS